MSKEPRLRKGFEQFRRPLFAHFHPFPGSICFSVFHQVHFEMFALFCFSIVRLVDLVDPVCITGDPFTGGQCEADADVEDRDFEGENQ